MPKKPEQPIVNIGELTLTPDQIREKAMQALGVMYGSIDPLDIARMMKTAQGQAANGDANARQFVYNVIRNGIPATPQQQAGPSVVNQISVGSDRSGPVSVHAFDPRDFKKAARFIVDHGPMLPAVAAEEFGISLGALDAMVKAGLFVNEPKGLMVTTAGRREAGISELRGGLA